MMTAQAWSAPRALLFDLDGTLVHSLPDLADAVDAVLASYGLSPLGENLVAPMVGNGSRKLIERALTAASAEKHRNHALAHPDALLQEAHDRFLQHYRQHLCVRSRLYPGVALQLTSLQAAGIKLALVTNKPSAFMAPLLESLHIGHHFSVLIGGDSLPEKKPSPLPLRYASEQLGVPVADCIMVGDSRNDIDAAHAAGMRCVAVSYGYNHGEPLALCQPDRLIDQFQQLPDCWAR